MNSQSKRNRSSAGLVLVTVMSANLCCVRQQAERKPKHKHTQTCRQGRCCLNVHNSLIPHLVCSYSAVAICKGVILGLWVRSVKEASLIIRGSHDSHSIINICPDE